MTPSAPFLPVSWHVAHCILTDAERLDTGLEGRCNSWPSSFHVPKRSSLSRSCGLSDFFRAVPKTAAKWSGTAGGSVSPLALVLTSRNLSGPILEEGKWSIGIRSTEVTNLRWFEKASLKYTFRIKIYFRSIPTLKLDWFARCLRHRRRGARAGSANNMSEWINMDAATGRGQVMNLNAMSHFVSQLPHRYS